jgi:hypothetical protein
MQLMSAGQIINHDCRVILHPDFCHIQDRHTGHLVGIGPGAMTHIIFGSLTGFIFLSLHPLVLPSLLHPHRRFLSGITVWVIFVVLNYMLCFVEVF